MFGKLSHRTLLVAFLQLLIPFVHLKPVESCWAVRPFCECRSHEELTINNRTLYQPDTIRLDCEAITDPVQFLGNRNLSKIVRPFSLKISNTRHAVVEAILKNLSSSLDLTASALRTNLNRLILFNLTEVRESTFDFDLLSFDRLNVVQFTSNSIAFLNCSRFGAQLQQIDLSKNQLRAIFGCSLVGDFPHLTDLDLSRNNLTFFELNRLSDLGQLLTINLAFNEWDCNNDLESLVRLAGGTGEPTRVRFLDENQLKCGLPRNLANLTFKSVYEIRNTEICSKCDCYAFRGNILGLNCTNRGLTEIPAKIPSNTKIVNFDHNSIERIDFKQFGEQELAVWANVIHLSIRRNKLSTLDGLDFNILNQVRLVNLTHNSLTSVRYETLSKMSKMDVVRIGSNPWICDCNAGALVFQRWIRTKKGLDLESIKCDDEGLPIYKLDSKGLCQKADHTYYWTVVNICLSVLIVLLLVKLLYDYMWKLKTGKLPYFFTWNW